MQQVLCIVLVPGTWRHLVRYLPKKKKQRNIQHGYILPNMADTTIVYKYVGLLLVVLKHNMPHAPAVCQHAKTRAADCPLADCCTLGAHYEHTAAVPYVLILLRLFCAAVHH